jgi:Flp pilus assembly protein TadD
MSDHKRRPSERNIHLSFGFNIHLAILLNALSLLTPWTSTSLFGQSMEQSNATSQRKFSQVLAQGSQALQKGDNVAAEQAFRDALALDPDSVPVLNNLAISLARQQRETEAISLYERALHLKPGDSVTRRNLGAAYFRARQYGPALPLLESSAREVPSFQLLEIAGLDAFALDRYDVAAHYLEAAHRAQPNDVETLDMLGKAYLRSGNYAGIRDVFGQIMVINPNSAAAHAMMAMAYDKLYREEDAIREFEAARAVDPTYPGIHTGLGVIYWRNHNFDAAERELRDELSRYPQDPIANCTLGRILRRRNNPSEAIPYLKAALAANPSYRDALLELGECWVQLEQSASAIEPLRNAIALEPDDAQAHYILGTALNKSGNQAEGARERALCAQLRAKQKTQ